MTNQIDKGPVGATHRYFHGSDMDWYCYTDRGLYRWFQGSWCASVHKTIKELANSCPLGRLEAIPAMPAQPAEDDLTWFAKNIHAWPAGDHQPWCYVYWKEGERHVSGNCITVIQPCVKIDRSDWLSRRAELQNKPSWDKKN